MDDYKKKDCLSPIPYVIGRQKDSLRYMKNTNSILFLRLPH